MTNLHDIRSVSARLIKLTHNEIQTLQTMLHRAVESGAPFDDAKEYIRLYSALRTRNSLSYQIEVQAVEAGETSYLQAQTEGKSEQEASSTRTFAEQLYRGQHYSIALYMTDEDIEKLGAVRC